MDSKPIQIKATLWFPILDNDDNPFEEETVSWLYDKLVEVLLNFTELGAGLGYWNGFTDHSRWFMAVVPEERLGAIRSFLSEARQRFRQETMYLDYHPVEKELVT